MDKIKKALQKFSEKEKVLVKLILKNLHAGIISGFDLKKLKNKNDIFRIRKGQIRIIYLYCPDGRIKILTIERRNDKTNNF